MNSYNKVKLIKAYPCVPKSCQIQQHLPGTIGQMSADLKIQQNPIWDSHQLDKGFKNIFGQDNLGGLFHTLFLCNHVGDFSEEISRCVIVVACKRTQNGSKALAMFFETSCNSLKRFLAFAVIFFFLADDER